MDYLTDHISWFSSLVLVVEMLLRIALAFRIIMRRQAVGVSFAWLMIVLAVPFGGALIYLTFGELRLGNRRAEWSRKIHAPYEEWLASVAQRHPPVQWMDLDPESAPLARLAESIFAVPPLPGNKLHLYPDWEHFFTALIEAIDNSERTCHLEFYIWSEGGLADEVVEALIRARDRGVICRILLDDVGSRPFLRGKQAQRLREAGVQLHAALPVGLFRMLFVRVDLRLHRKIVIIDGEVAYTGSLNLVDPRYFKQDAGVGQWVDAMVRVEGPAVEGLAITFLEDWELETSEGIEKLRKSGDVHELDEVGDVVVQTIPSGPAFETKAIQDVLLMTIYSAQQEIILTSPYFVPDEVLATALATAARRGVEVTLVVPAHVDSILVRYASQAYKGDLLEAGVKIAQFEGGLLHTKSVSVDGEYALFGSLNLDSRSLHLNFEITLAVYNREFTHQLRQLQQTYIDDSTWMDLAEWQGRSFPVRLMENGMRLLSPLL